jgi:hypothetical protein
MRFYLFKPEEMSLGSQVIFLICVIVEVKATDTNQVSFVFVWWRTLQTSDPLFNYLKQRWGEISPISLSCARVCKLRDRYVTWAA